jgi:ABC-2 type transport system permease protein
MRNSKIYLSIVKEIFKADLKHFLAYPMNAFFFLFLPVNFLLPIYFLSESFGLNSGNTTISSQLIQANYLDYIIVGFFMSSFISSIFWGVGQSLSKEFSMGTLESIWILPYPKLLFLVGKSLFNTFQSLLSGILLVLFSIIFFNYRSLPEPIDILKFSIVLLPMLFVLYGLSFVYSSLVLYLKNAGMISDLLNYLTDMIAGRQNPITIFPKFLFYISLACPVTYIYDISRAILVNENTLFKLSTEILLLIVLGIASLITGIVLFNRTQKTIQMNGTIGSY